MASNINTTSIDADFPVAGQDNDSQGFRDNFSTIKQNFVATKSEVEDLQNNVARKDEDNNFLGNQVSNADFINNVETVFPGGTVTSGQNVSFENGHLQTFTIGASITLTLSDLPESGKHGKIRLMLLNDGTSRTVTWAISGGGTVKKDSAWPTEDTTTVIASDTNYTVIDFFTIDGGTTVFAEYKGLYD